MIRSIIQLSFLALVTIGVFIVGGNAERWCPFGGVEALYTYINEGNMVCSLEVSNFYILGAVLFSALFLKRAFCGYACPIGILSEWINRGAKKIGIKPISVSEETDKKLSLLKYIILGVTIFITWETGELIFRSYGPGYALLSRHGEDITFFTYAVAGFVILLSLFIAIPFCRWLCPLAAVLNPFSRISPVGIKRDEETCTDCGKCAKVCSMAIPVDRVEKVNHARCTSCLDCIDACPERDAGALKGGSGSRIVVVALLLLFLGSAVGGTNLFPVPSFTWDRGLAAPEKKAEIFMEVDGLKCRGSANLFVYLLDRNDELEIKGFLQLEAWPGPGKGRARVFYDPAFTDEITIKAAITEASYDIIENQWRTSPFKIRGYDPLEHLFK